MTITERIQLHKLGYTKDEINQLAADNYNPEGLVNPPENPVAAPAAIGVQEEEPAQLPSSPQPDNSITDVLAAINNLAESIKVSNIRSSQQPAQPTPNEKADDLLFTFLNT